MVTRKALDRLAGVGPYFALSHGPRPDGHPFRPLTALYSEPRTLRDYVTEVGRRLGGAHPRVSASTLHIGTAARLWSVAVGGAVLGGGVLDLSPERLRWRVPEAGPIELWLPEVRTAAPGDDVDALHRTVFVANLLPLEEALRREYGLSPQTALGNAASALVGTVRVLGARMTAPGPSPLALGAALLDRAPLDRAGVLTTDPLTYRRRSCCLYYRVPQAGYCGDCVLTERKRRT
ncbi:(2Fe-2S)-binding protein [Streptomyces sp. OF3]|uniref:(2Fe-2S)-binding protein n=1 Tax=Streptomyces alkaliterrae TaxID=2213162 RepID=A0A7W3WL05_9ACTN|nr:(2Fe-2S)-binding protein [Streptomyces alkaliterrae]MBB1254234.1 (2Fe-2S)-binding protein [Streptomyces alkaliterrae]